MKLMMKAVLVVLMLVSVSASAQDTAEEKATPMKRVMELHDQTMGKMPEIVRLIGALETKVDSTTVDKRYETAISKLKNANKSMADWMAGFGEDFTSEEMYKGKELSPEKLEWLNKHETKLRALDEQIKVSIGYANSLLGR